MPTQSRALRLRRGVFIAILGLASCQSGKSVILAPVKNEHGSVAVAGTRVAAPQAVIATTLGRGPAPQASASTTPRGAAPQAGDGPRLPTPNSGFDYQLGGAYPVPVGVTVVGRDRTDMPASGVYSICYVNGFQTQPGEHASWITNHPELVLRDVNNQPVIDPTWPDEYILDVSSAPKRDAIAAIIDVWIDGCAASGFQAVEIDNLDTYARFPTRLTIDNAIALAQTYRDRAHAASLAIAQKNAADMVARRSETRFDFAVVEQCGEFSECGAFTLGYGDQVYDIEYKQSAFNSACARFPQLSIVRRDVNLVVASNPAYVREAC